MGGKGSVLETKVTQGTQDLRWEPSWRTQETQGGQMDVCFQ